MKSGTTFQEYRARWADLPSSVVLEMAGTLPEREQAEMWDALAERCRLRIEAEREVDRQREEEWPPPKRHHPTRRSQAAMSATPRAVSLSSDDPLKNIEPRLYVEALTGETVPANGWLSCPLPDHDDRTPSFQVLQSHWRCFGCSRGGGIIDFGAALYGLEPRGAGYHEIRRRLLADLGLRSSV